MNFTQSTQIVHLAKSTPKSLVVRSGLQGMTTMRTCLGSSDECGADSDDSDIIRCSLPYNDSPCSINKKRLTDLQHSHRKVVKRLNFCTFGGKEQENSVTVQLYNNLNSTPPRDTTCANCNKDTTYSNTGGRAKNSKCNHCSIYEVRKMDSNNWEDIKSLKHSINVQHDVHRKKSRQILSQVHLNNNIPTNKANQHCVKIKRTNKPRYREKISCSSRDGVSVSHPDLLSTPALSLRFEDRKITQESKKCQHYYGNCLDEHMVGFNKLNCFKATTSEENNLKMNHKMARTCPKVIYKPSDSACIGEEDNSNTNITLHNRHHVNVVEVDRPSVASENDIKKDVCVENVTYIKKVPSKDTNIVHSACKDDEDNLNISFESNSASQSTNVLGEDCQFNISFESHSSVTTTELSENETLITEVLDKSSHEESFVFGTDCYRQCSKYTVKAESPRSQIKQIDLDSLRQTHLADDLKEAQSVNMESASRSKVTFTATACKEGLPTVLQYPDSSCAIPPLNTTQEDDIPEIEDCNSPRKEQLVWSRTIGAPLLVTSTPKRAECTNRSELQSEFPITIEEVDINDIQSSNNNLSLSMNSYLKQPSCETSKSLNVVSPVRADDGGVSLLQLFDSAKKKKYKRNSLPERLQRLVARQRSTGRIWEHELRRSHQGDRGLKVRVVIVWHEGVHTLVRCQPQVLESGQPDMVMLLDTDIVRLPQIRPGMLLTVFPPWQVLNMPAMGVQFLLCITHVEVRVSHDAGVKPTAGFGPENEAAVVMQTFGCPCLSKGRTVADRVNCNFQLPRDGAEFLDLFLCKPQAMVTSNKESLFQMSSDSACVEKQGTINFIVTNSCQLQSNSVWVTVCVQRVFSHRQNKSQTGNSENVRDTKSHKGEDFRVMWSLLGCDSNGEYCVIDLGEAPQSTDVQKNITVDSSFTQPSKCQGKSTMNVGDDVTTRRWAQVVSREVVGRVVRLSGFSPTMRIYRGKDPGLWAVFESGNQEEANINTGPTSASLADNSLQQSAEKNSVKNQLFTYVLSPSTKIWEIEEEHNAPNFKWRRPQVHLLADILAKGTGTSFRVTLLVQLLCVADHCLYVTDSSLGQPGHPPYVQILLRFACVVPEVVLQAKRGVLYLQDVEVLRGRLSADKYTYITVPSRDSAVLAIPCLESLNQSVATLRKMVPEVASLSLGSTPGDLVVLSGTVVGVDEDTAFSWPVCEICDSESVSEREQDSWICQQCGVEVSVKTKLSLDVFVCTPALPMKCKIKLKLLQESIVELLSPVHKDEECYSLAAFLGTEVKPTLCLVLKKDNPASGLINIVLQQIAK